MQCQNRLLKLMMKDRSDFDHVDGDGQKVGERSEAGAEIVERVRARFSSRDPNACCNYTVTLSETDVLRDLDAKIVQRDARPSEGLVDLGRTGPRV